MGHNHTPAAISLAAKLVERVSKQTRQILSCPVYTDFMDHVMDSDCPYPSVRPSSSTILTNFSQRSPVTFVGVSQRAAQDGWHATYLPAGKAADWNDHLADCSYVMYLRSSDALRWPYTVVKDGLKSDVVFKPQSFFELFATRLETPSIAPTLRHSR